MIKKIKIDFHKNSLFCCNRANQYRARIWIDNIGGILIGLAGCGDTPSQARKKLKIAQKRYNEGIFGLKAKKTLVRMPQEGLKKRKLM